MSTERDDASNRWVTLTGALRDDELLPNAIDLDRVNDVVLNALPSATAAMRNANTGTIKRQLIPIYLKMDNELASAGEEVASPRYWPRPSSCPRGFYCHAGKKQNCPVVRRVAVPYAA